MPDRQDARIKRLINLATPLHVRGREGIQFSRVYLMGALSLLKQGVKACLEDMPTGQREGYYTLYEQAFDALIRLVENVEGPPRPRKVSRNIVGHSESRQPWAHPGN